MGPEVSAGARSGLSGGTPRILLEASTQTSGKGTCFSLILGNFAQNQETATP